MEDERKDVAALGKLMIVVYGLLDEMRGAFPELDVSIRSTLPGLERMNDEQAAENLEDWARMLRGTLHGSGLHRTAYPSAVSDALTDAARRLRKKVEATDG